LPEPQFSISDGFVTTIWRKPFRDNVVVGEVTEEIKRLVLVIDKNMKRVEIQHALGLRHEAHFRDAYLIPSLQAGFIQMTVPEKPKSSRQKYRLTAQGLALRILLTKHTK
jgi:ATP-dependent DNA helicase RecG